jgi:hypothetical protein
MNAEAKEHGTAAIANTSTLPTVTLIPGRHEITPTATATVTMHTVSKPRTGNMETGWNYRALAFLARFGFALVACAPGRGISLVGFTRAISAMASLVFSGMWMLVSGFATGSKYGAYSCWLLLSGSPGASIKSTSGPDPIISSLKFKDPCVSWYF